MDGALLFNLACTRQFRLFGQCLINAETFHIPAQYSARGDFLGRPRLQLNGANEGLSASSSISGASVEGGLSSGIEKIRWTHGGSGVCEFAILGNQLHDSEMHENAICVPSGDHDGY